MILNKTALAVLGIGAIYVGTVFANPTTKTSVPADNSKVNEKIKNSGELTADESGMGAADTELTRSVRDSILSDKTLSMHGRNVKVIVLDGMVTLKGPVKSNSEKMAIEKKAAAVAGANRLRNEMEVLTK